jgi:HK97 family phage portal protein
MKIIDTVKGIGALVRMAGNMGSRGYNLEDPNTPMGQAFLGIGGVPGRAGVTVTERNAMTYAPVQSCVRIIAESMASVPLCLYKRLPGGGREKARAHRLWSVLHDRPNPLMTSFTFRETMLGHLLIWGNFFAEIQFNGLWQPVALWPLAPWNTKKLLGADNKITYEVTVNGVTKTLQDWQVLHIPGMGFDGLLGKSTVLWAAESIGIGMAIDQYSAHAFGNGLNPSGFLSTDKKLDPAGAKNLRDAWDSTYAGLSNAFRVAVLQDGMKWQALGMTPEDAQMIAAKGWQLSEIARIFRVPLNLLMDNSKGATGYNSVEQASIDFVIHTLRPWAVRIEQAMTWALITRPMGDYYIEFNLDGLLRGDFATRQNGLAVMRQNGIINANEWRDVENMNPIEGEAGTAYITLQNMQPINKPSKEADATGIDVTVDPADKAVGQEAEPIRSLVGVARPMIQDAVGRALNLAARAVRENSARSDATLERIEEQINGEKVYRGIRANLEPLAATFGVDLSKLAGMVLASVMDEARESWGNAEKIQAIGGTQMLVSILATVEHELIGG